MANSFRLIPNKLRGGQACLLTIEGISEPNAVLRKKCTLRVFELDANSQRSEQCGKDDLLAEFSTEIIPAPFPDRFRFNPDKTERTDSFETSLPGPEYRSDPKGNRLPVPLEYTPAHFKLNPFGCQETTHVVLIRGEKGETDGCIFEIGFSLLIGRNETFNSFKTPAYVDCGNLLAANCTSAAEFYRSNHQQLLATRGVGTHFGNQFVYHAYTTERSYLEAICRSEFGAIDNAWIRANTGRRWSDSDKARFDGDRTRYGLEVSSCIDFVRSAMQLGFAKTGMEADWKLAWSHVKGGRGDLLAKGLTQTGWTSLYYNPDVNHPDDDGPAGTREHKSANEHTFSYKEAREKMLYYGIPVHDFLVNYHPTTISANPGFREVGSFNREPGATTPRVLASRDILSRPFGFVIARGGRHTALWVGGRIVEVHWDVGPWPVAPTEHPLFDSCDFVEEWPWNSGLILLPPKVK